MWRRYAEPALWATWAPHIRGVDYPLARLLADTAGTVCGPLGLRVPFTVDAIDEQSKTWAWTVHLRLWGRAMVTVSLAHGVEEHGEGCATWLRLHGAWPVVLGYAPVAWYAMRRLVH